MKLFLTPTGVILESQQGNFKRVEGSWDETVNRLGLYQWLRSSLSEFQDGEEPAVNDLLAPIGSQEVWAAGVTYRRSKDARMDESRKSGASVFYDKVYAAERPELFFKASPSRVVGHGKSIRIRKDSTWNVPEPELTLFISSEGTIEGFTVGNDVSSRSIEGENPLYLPQAKMYEGSTALGPCLYVPEKQLVGNTLISLDIIRQERSIYSDSAPISRMKRKLDELAGWLFRELRFPYGAYLMTGTCLVPPDGFTLQVGDIVRIAIEGIGTLENTVAA